MAFCRPWQNANLKGNSAESIVDFYIERCNNLLEKQESGLLDDWNGVYQFVSKNDNFAVHGKIVVREGAVPIL